MMAFSGINILFSNTEKTVEICKKRKFGRGSIYLLKYMLKTKKIGISLM